MLIKGLVVLLIAIVTAFFGADGLVMVLAAVGAMRGVVYGLAKFAAITPSQRDDRWLDKFDKVLVEFEYWLDRLSGGLPQNEARRE
ncbi:MAG: hypothetical protein JJU10_05535 [Idiomarina sp.]|nr:hypothetical protein [Idiomarina sp.]